MSRQQRLLIGPCESGITTYCRSLPPHFCLLLCAPACSPATGVKLTEASWPPEGFAVEGELTASFDRIPEGASVQHTCVGRQAAGCRCSLPCCRLVRCCPFRSCSLPLVLLPSFLLLPSASVLVLPLLLPLPRCCQRLLQGACLLPRATCCAAGTS